MSILQAKGAYVKYGTSMKEGESWTVVSLLMLANYVASQFATFVGKIDFRGRTK